MILKKTMYMSRKQKKTLKSEIIASFFAIIVILSLFLFSFLPASADDDLDYAYRIDFEDYELGNLHGQFNWETIAVSGQSVDVEEIEESLPVHQQVVKISALSLSAGARKYFNGAVNDFDKLELWWRGGRMDLYVADINDNVIGAIEVEDDDDDDVYNLRISSGTYDNKVIVETIPANWGLYSIEIDLKVEFKTFGLPGNETYMYRVNDCDWYDVIDNLEPKIEIFRIINADGSGVFDDIYFSYRGCSSMSCELCGNSDDCESAGCIWNWETMTCESDYEEYGTCGSGENLIFCDNETDCENAGGYWIAGTCFENEPESTSDFLDYYADNSEKFNEPTIIFQKLANFFEPIYQTLSGFLITFQDKFNLSSASYFGTLTGNAIGRASGYLKVVNDFFGGLPIAEGITIFLMISIAVIVIRVIFRLISFIKP